MLKYSTKPSDPPTWKPQEMERCIDDVTPSRVDSILGPGPFRLSQRDFDAIEKMVRKDIEPTLDEKKLDLLYPITLS